MPEINGTERETEISDRFSVFNPGSISMVIGCSLCLCVCVCMCMLCMYVYIYMYACMFMCRYVYAYVLI